MIPARKLGFVILTNRGGGNTMDAALRNRLLDALLGAPERDWSTEYLARSREEIAAGEKFERDVAAARTPGTRPALPLPRYAGRYTDRAFGAATVRHENGRLLLTLGPRHAGELKHWHHDTFRVDYENPAMGWSLVTFNFAHDGGVKEMDVGGVRTYARAADEGPR